MQTQPTYLAAVDLGSNSFHMIISRWQDGRLTEVARKKVMVQLARGMDAQQRLSPAALERASDCLHQFRQLLDRHDCSMVRIIGTQALRQCSNLGEFLQMAEPILGAAVDIISGEQEAKLVYQGVQYFLPPEHKDNPVLVIDLGGASTELIVGRGRQIQRWHSLQLGCVDLANRFFKTPSGPVSAEALDQARQYSCTLIEPLRSEFDSRHWQLATGASGTLRVALELLPPATDPAAAPPSVITREELHRIVDDLKHSGALSESIPDSLRWDVLPAGLALLQGLFDTLGVEQLTVSAGSIKEGLMLNALANG